MTTKIDHVARTLLVTEHIPSYAKKLFPNQYAELKEFGFFDIDIFPWHPYAPTEDDTYPEQIVDKTITLGLTKTLNRKKHLRKSYIRTQQILLEKNVRFSTDSFTRVAWDITTSFFHSNIINNKRKFLSNEYDYFNMIFANANNTHVIKSYVTVQNVPLGFYLAEQIDDTYSCLYGLIILRDKIKFLSDLMMLEILSNLPTQYLNLGGSEDTGIHAFKKSSIPQMNRPCFG